MPSVPVAFWRESGHGSPSRHHGLADVIYHRGVPYVGRKLLHYGTPDGRGEGGCVTEVAVLHGCSSEILLRLGPGTTCNGPCFFALHFFFQKKISFALTRTRVMVLTYEAGWVDSFFLESVYFLLLLRNSVMVSDISRFISEWSIPISQHFQKYFR